MYFRSYIDRDKSNTLPKTKESTFYLILQKIYGTTLTRVKCQFFSSFSLRLCLRKDKNGRNVFPGGRHLPESPLKEERLRTVIQVSADRWTMLSGRWKATAPHYSVNVSLKSILVFHGSKSVFSPTYLLPL